MKKRGPYKKRPLEVRFRSRYVKSATCWIWDGPPNHNGYGQFCPKEGHVVRAHRMSYELYIGQIPRGKKVLHTCDNRLCVNPAHLFIGTTQDNADDCVSKDRQRKGEEHGMAKLTERAARFVLSKKGKMSSTVLAKAFRVDPCTIQRIWSGHSWKHL